MALFSATDDHWRWLSMDSVLTAWDQAPISIEFTELLHLLADVSRSPLDTKPGDPLPPNRPDSPVRIARGYGIEIAFVVVTPAEMTHGLRLANIRSHD